LHLHVQLVPQGQFDLRLRFLKLCTDPCKMIKIDKDCVVHMHASTNATTLAHTQQLYFTAVKMFHSNTHIHTHTHTHKCFFL
jgi:hypothetical protein